MAAGVGVKVGIGGATVETGEDIEVGIGVGGWTTAGAQAEKINVDNSSQLIKNIACRFTGFTFFCTIVLVSYPVLTLATAQKTNATPAIGQPLADCGNQRANSPSEIEKLWQNIGSN